jgi:hypothetical protein
MAVRRRIDNIVFFRKHRNARSTSTGKVIPDIWRIVASFLDPSTLTKLCLVSSSFLEIFRPILYRHLNLTFFRRDSRFTNLTLNLLCSHNNLAQYVISFSTYKPFPSIDYRRRWNFVYKLLPGTQYRLIEAISRMTSLQTLTIHNSVFTNIAEERTFVQRLKECNIPIKKFSFTSDISSSEKSDLSVNFLILNNLTSLTWNTRRIISRDRCKLCEMQKTC